MRLLGEWPMTSAIRAHKFHTTDDRIITLTSLALFGAILLYQLTKSFIGFHYEDNLGQTAIVNPLAMLLFLGVSILVIASTPAILNAKNRLTISIVIVSFSLLLSVSFSFGRKLDWTNMDVPQDSVALAQDVQRAGVLPFVATYNDRGNPGPAGSSPYATSVHALLNSLGLDRLAAAKWLGAMPTDYGRPFMHPPLFFLILAGWQSLFGASMLAATVFMWIVTAMWGWLCYALLDKLEVNASIFLTLLFITLPTTIQDTWFPTYDVLSGAFLMAGFTLFILAFQRARLRLYLFAGLAFSLSLMFRLTSIFFILILALALLYLLLRARQRLTGLLLLALGLLSVPLVFLALGYNPLLTLVTAMYRQEIFYDNTAVTLIKRLPVIFYLGIPILTLAAYAAAKHARTALQSPNLIFLLIPILAALPLAIETRLSPDFHRNMIGISGCMVLALAVLGAWPASKRSQVILIAINLLFTLLTTLL
jgi:hypothetical protein